MVSDRQSSTIETPRQHDSQPESAVEAAGDLQIRGVSRLFRTADGLGTLALANFTLDVADGAFVTLIGPSGCGKSTLLRLVAGLDEPTAGELRLGGEPIAGPGADRGLMFQDPNLFPWLTVRGNVGVGPVARGVHRGRRAEIDEYIALVGLQAFGDHYPHQLSGGMAQRVALARALINHPRVLLLDEPLGALDQFTRMRMQDEVLRLWQARRTTTLMVTHDVDEAIYVSDRIAVMSPHPGRIESMIDVDLPRPRRRNDPAFLRLRTEIIESLDFTGGETDSD